MQLLEQKRNAVRLGLRFVCDPRGGDIHVLADPVAERVADHHDQVVCLRGWIRQRWILDNRIIKVGRFAGERFPRLHLADAVAERQAPVPALPEHG